MFVSCGIPAGDNSLTFFRIIGNGPTNTRHPVASGMESVLYDEDDDGVQTYLVQDLEDVENLTGSKRVRHELMLEEVSESTIKSIQT